ncbi:MAG: PQQ-binding-like beta-propeller repeat protein, partial [Planctomycetota bacterium]|nr:PQQ-binding-like beta-propeller repeat protein [Planctomycetota bacterium]
MLSSLNLVITIMSAAPIAQTDDISLEGVSVPLRLDYAVELENAISFIDQQRWADGIPILHRLAQSDGEAVFQFKSSHFVGIADAAITQLQNLPALGAEWYQNNFQHQAEALVNNFSKPLNLIRLEKTALLYSGLPASQQATHNLEQAYRDRNFHELLGFDYSPRSPIMGTESIRSAFSYQFDDTYPLRFQGHRVVTGHGLIYATNGHDVVALDQSSGAVVWKYDNHTWDGIDDSLNRELHAAQSQHTLLQPVLSDGILLVGIHLAKSVGRNDRYRNIDIRHMIPIRRLHAFDAKSGDLLWIQEEPTKENITREIAAGPPSVSAGRAYLPIYDAGGNVDVSLLCLDLYSGKKIFKTFLASGSMGTNLFGNLLTEVSTPQPLIHGKQLWMTTQLGTISCINTRTGHLKWTRTYPRSKVVVHQDGRVSQRVHHFGNNDLFYDNKVIAAAPLDSTNLLFLDANTGNTIRQLPAQARDDNNQHHLVSFDNELVTTSGNHTQQFKLRGGIPLVTSQRLYRYNGFSNENVLPPQLTVSNIWTPFEDGVSAAKRDDITKSDLQFYWGSLPGTAIGPIQAIDGSLLVLNRSGLTSLQCSDSIQLCLEQDYLSRRDLDYLLTFPAHDYRVVQNILKRLTDFLKRQPNLSIFDKELANLIIARCHLSLGNKAAALPILRKLKGAIDLDISWQAEVLFCQSVQIASDKLRSAPQRSAILISRNSVPAAALIAYLDTDWQILMSLYLDRDFENKELLKSWIEQIIKQHSKVFEVEQWLTQQLLQNESHPQRRAQLYKAAFEFTSKQFDQHQILLKATTESATVISQIDDASPQQLPTQWKLLHAFGDNDEILLFSSQQTLILVEGQDINYINPFGNRASVVSSLP